MTDQTLTLPRPGRTPRRARALATRTPLIDALGDHVGAVSPERLEHARRAVRPRVLAIRRGNWAAREDATHEGAHGFVIIEGSVLRRVAARHREGAELLGPGDLLQPAADVDIPVVFRAVTDMQVAVVDGRTLVDAGQVPEVVAALLNAAAARTNTVARQLVVAQWPSVDERIVATMEMLAERWGVVSPDGLVLPDFLTHSVIAPLVGARRPSVTTSLKRLSETGAVRRAPDGRWIVARREL